MAGLILFAMAPAHLLLSVLKRLPKTVPVSPHHITADLRAAAVFLEFLTQEQATSSLQQIQQPDLDRFLAEQNGYRTGVRAFLRYLNREEKLFRKLSQPSVARGLTEDVFLSRAKYEACLSGPYGSDCKDWMTSPQCTAL